MYENLGLRLGRVPREWRAILDHRLVPLGLTQTRWVTLYNLWQAGNGLSQCELARLIGVEAPSLVRTLDQLVEQGLVERRQCGEDRRAKRIYLTEKAGPLLEKIVDLVTETRQEMLKGLTPEELEKLIDVLKKIERNTQAILEQQQNRGCCPQDS